MPFLDNPAGGALKYSRIVRQHSNSYYSSLFGIVTKSNKIFYVIGICMYKIVILTNVKQIKSAHGYHDNNVSAGPW